MKIFVIVVFVLLFLGLLLPYLNFQIYLDTLSNLGYIGEFFGGLISAIVGVVAALTSYQLLLSIVLVTCGIAAIGWIFDLF